jgi:hypothetical protein
VDDPWLEADPESVASYSQSKVQRAAATYVPAIILTEGKTDAEFLQVALEVLYPHLTDLIRFLDYEQRAEGSVSALLRNVRAFAAAGIVNRVIAVCDNDTAASDELRKLAKSELPQHIRVIQYPDLDHARNYPTLGPPTTNHPMGSPDVANINGLACSIELYLGHDVLKIEDGSFRPVQWRAFIPGMAPYQGEIVGKREVHESFRAKASVARSSPEAVRDQDWEGLRLILDVILSQLGRPVTNATSN